MERNDYFREKKYGSQLKQYKHSYGKVATRCSQSRDEMLLKSHPFLVVLRKKKKNSSEFHPSQGPVLPCVMNGVTTVVAVRSGSVLATGAAADGLPVDDTI